MTTEGKRTEFRPLSDHDGLIGQPHSLTLSHSPIYRSASKPSYVSVIWPTLLGLSWKRLFTFYNEITPFSKRFDGDL